MSIKSGDFEIDVWVGGYPVWCILRHDGERIAQIHHAELSDLIYALKKAQKVAKGSLPENYKHEFLEI